MPGIFDYIDDFIICSNSFEEITEKLNKILKIFQKHNLTLNLNKCSFHTKSVNYLGFKIDEYIWKMNLKSIFQLKIQGTQKYWTGAQICGITTICILTMLWRYKQQFHTKEVELGCEWFEISKESSHFKIGNRNNSLQS